MLWIPHSQGYSLFMLSSPPQPHSLFIKGKEKKNTIRRNISMRIPTFSTCAFLCLSSSACVRVALSSSFSLELCPFLYPPHKPPSHFYRSFFFCSCICLCTFPPPRALPFPTLIIMFSVIFSVSKLFVPFSVSFLSLLGPCVEGGQRRLSSLCG